MKNPPPKKEETPNGDNKARAATWETLAEGTSLSRSLDIELVISGTRCCRLALRGDLRTLPCLARPLRQGLRACTHSRTRSCRLTYIGIYVCV